MLGGPTRAREPVRIAVETVSASGRIVFDQRVRQHARVGDRKIEPFRTRRRHDVRGIAREVQRAELHRLQHEASHRDIALLKNRPSRERPAVTDFESRCELGPNAFVGPVIDRVFGIALEIQSLHFARPRAHERKSAFAIRVNMTASAKP